MRVGYSYGEQYICLFLLATCCCYTYMNAIETCKNWGLCFTFFQQAQIYTEAQMLSNNPPLPAWASYQIRKITSCACAGNAGNVSPRHQFQRKSLVSEPGVHHDSCVAHVPWCMSGSLTCGDGENVPGIPGTCATRNFMYMYLASCPWELHDYNMLHGQWWHGVCHDDSWV